MKHLLTVAAATTPFCAALAIQDILSDLKDEFFPQQNPLDAALESSPTFTPIEVLDPNANDDHKYTFPNTDNVGTWIENFFRQPFDEVIHPPSDVDLDLDLVDPADIGHPHHHSDKTIYQLINESKYTTILAKIVNEDEELVKCLNSTDHKFTFFAPTDHAFRKIPCHHRHHDHDHGHDHDSGNDDNHHIPKELVRALLRYHSSPEVLSAIKLFHRHTIPSALDDPLLGTTEPADDDDNNDKKEEKGLPQRLTVRTGFKGLTLNFYSHIVAADIGASNGLIHGLDAILLPPPRTLLLLDILPTKFSTFNLALYKTHLNEHLNTTTSKQGRGFTVFVPSNTAFQRLPLRVTAFLFSPPGLKYLRALLSYHIVPRRTLYSDVLYTSKSEIKPFSHAVGEKVEGGFTHLDLPTLLEGHEIAVDVVHLGLYVSFKVNGYQRVAFADALARDGVLHVVDRVLIPPRRLKGVPVDDEEEVEVELEDLMERLGPWVEWEHDEDNGVAEIGERSEEL
ncbi:FAS1 domain-containing protein [Aspergillus egyptiacus]|nr:FAS1 domain-containing protein [Aspergillus egyptiacus]